MRFLAAYQLIATDDGDSNDILKLEAPPPPRNDRKSRVLRLVGPEQTGVE